MVRDKKSLILAQERRLCITREASVCFECRREIKAGVEHVFHGTTYLHLSDSRLRLYCVEMCFDCDADWLIVLRAKFRLASKRLLYEYGRLRQEVMELKRYGGVFTFEEEDQLQRWWWDPSHLLPTGIVEG